MSQTVNVERRVYKPAEVATITGMHPETVRRWCRQKRIRATRSQDTPKGHWLIPKAEVDRLVGEATSGDGTKSTEA